MDSVFHSPSDISVFGKESAHLIPATECCQMVGACSVSRRVGAVLKTPLEVPASLYHLCKEQGLASLGCGRSGWKCSCLEQQFLCSYLVRLLFRRRTIASYGFMVPSAARLSILS